MSRLGLVVAHENRNVKLVGPNGERRGVVRVGDDDAGGFSEHGRVRFRPPGQSSMGSTRRPAAFFEGKAEEKSSVLDAGS